MTFQVYRGATAPLPGVGPTKHTDTGAPIIDFTPTRPISSVLAQLPSTLAGKYTFDLSRDRADLTIDPVRMQAATRGATRGGFSSRDSVNGGKVIRLDGGPFKNAEWITASFRDLVKGSDQLEQLRANGYDLDFKREMLVVNSEHDTGATIFAFSKDASKPGLVAVCSEVTVLDMSLDGRSSGGGNITVRKPVIYVYPKQPTDVRVQVSIKGQFIAQYPKAKDGVWNVHASPDGTLFDRVTERRYSYLFWEGTNKDFTVDPTQAFCISGRDAETFLEKACASYGLNDREKTDFVSYWLPHLEKNDLSLVQFLSTEAYEAYAHMEVTPAPETTIRMFMVFQKAHGMEKVGNPTLPTLTRKGYTVVEWGGANLDERT